MDSPIVPAVRNRSVQGYEAADVLVEGVVVVALLDEGFGLSVGVLHDIWLASLPRPVGVVHGLRHHPDPDLAAMSLVA